MKRWSLALILVALLGCEHQEPLPPVPAPPEDLSTWSVPELVQPETQPAPEALPPAAKEKASAGEHIHDYSPSATYTVTVATSVPLDILLEPGEQVRNVIGGD